ncbi:MAG TPA: NAD(P)-binding domain-containing protein [Acidimicrobiales bacterium]|nr:NAD(P)-binding domain-containing protein [Acidimicrobiales bacterium]
MSRASHDVLICLSRPPGQLAARAAEPGDHVSAASTAYAVASADVVMLAVPWDAIDQALAEAGALAGKVVLDATNPYGAGPKPAEGRTVAEFNSGRMPTPRAGGPTRVGVGVGGALVGLRSGNFARQSVLTSTS